MTDDDKCIDQLVIDSIRMLAVEAIEKANSGHPGLPLGLSPAAYILWKQFLRHNPRNPNWMNRDRFVFSAGHGSAMLYALLHIFGYDVSLDDLKNFRQWQSRTPGHPEYGMTPGVEATAGPLGQGFAMGVGMAMAERFLAQIFNKQDMQIVDHYTYGIVSDGDLMEGISYEAASIAGYHKLGKLIYLYDDNDISIDGSTDLTFSEDVQKRFEALHWHVVNVADGNNLDAMAKAIKEAQSVKDQPSLIIIKTHIGFGSPKQDHESSHGAPLGSDALAKTKEFYSWPQDKSFYVPDSVYDYMKKNLNTMNQFEEEWNGLFRKYSASYKADAQKFTDAKNNVLPDGWDKGLKAFDPAKGQATRDASGTVMNQLAEFIPNIIGGSADLASSVKTILKSYPVFNASGTTAGRNIHFGIREHAMGSITNGLALHGGVIPYASTFFVFSDYMRPSLRMAAIMKVHSIFVFSHDSIGVGEDGPTHQPIEHLMSLRAIPGLTVLRPADANETLFAWKYAVSSKKPVVLILTRQKLPVMPVGMVTEDGFRRGAYILDDCAGTPDIIMISSGSEVQHIVEAKKIMAKNNVKVRLVSMPSWELFEHQPAEYKATVLPPKVSKRLAIEAGTSLGWQKWVGDQGIVIGIDHFGASAPGDLLMEKFGFTAQSVVEKAQCLLNK
ncbi:MAG: transketolase [Candidatus Auribacter fodinae]|uniref:Transketolase n=1 Tax=Candidatus Auribacter fodinae TaxID=2093366 RepID=A0A3A4R5X2_9BACT|nr:MAG: transketolase [Candidatus Auribacter fodinae]